MGSLWVEVSALRQALRRLSRRSASTFVLFSRMKYWTLSTAIVEVQRDFGNRSDRKVARLKYLIADWGVERFRKLVVERLGKPLTMADPPEVTAFCDHLGWTEQGDGRLFYGLNVENGRIRDGDDMQLKTALPRDRSDAGSQHKADRTSKYSICRRC